MNSSLRAVILTANWFEDTEVLYPLYRLREAGVDVHVAAPARGRLRGVHLYGVAADLAFADVNPENEDLLIIPGGPRFGAPGTVSRHAEALKITRVFFQANKPVAAICHGPMTLAAADVVRGRTLTSIQNDGVPDDVRKAGGTWEDHEVMVDGNLITSRHPADLPAFMREVMRALQVNT